MNMAGPPPLTPSMASLPEGVLTVTQAAGLISRVLDAGVPKKLKIVGEISNFNERTHWYFRLKDEEAVLDCVMFAASARKAGFAPASGQKVLATGRIEFYGKQGRTQVYVEALDPIGTGELEQRLRRLVEEVRGLGWLDPARKRRLPTFPHRVAVVTSRSGAALQDVLSTMKRRCPAVDVILVDVRVQGEGAAGEIARAIDWLSLHAGDHAIDALLVTRGGGSIEDLWAFNERIVAEAIVRCAVPVAAAIGHETDTTLAELVADERCSTPTQAAMRLTPDIEALTEQIDQASARLAASAARRVQRAGDRQDALGRRAHHAAHRAVALRAVRIEKLSARLAHARPESVYAARRSRLADQSARLARAMSDRVRAADPESLSRELLRAWQFAFERRLQRLTALERELILAGPASVLARGYSLTMRQDGSLIRSVADVAEGDIVTTRVAEGTFQSVVRDALPAAAREAEHAPPRPGYSTRVPARSRKKRGQDPGQLGLF